MKKCIKLLSCIMAFAIVMSMVVLPVSAASTNIAGGSCKYGSETKYNKNPYEFTCLGTYDTMWVRNTPVESGKTYYFSYEVMIKNTTKSIETWKAQGQTINGITSQTISVPASTYYKFEGIGTAASTGNLHFGPRIMCNDTSKTVYLKNPKVYEKSDLSVSTDATAEMALDGVITYSFTNPVNNLAASDFIGVDVDVTQVSDCVYTVAPKNLTYNTSYALTMTNVTDVFGQTITENTVNFTTESLPVTTVSTNATAVMSINPVITYTFSAPLKADLAASNFTGADDVVVTPVSETVYEVALSGLDYSTAYTLTMSNVVDANDQAVEDLTINFTTEAKPVTYPVAENLLTSGYVRDKSNSNVTFTQENGVYTVSIPENYTGGTVAWGRPTLEPGVYVGTVEVLNVDIPGDGIRAQAESHGITGTSTRTVSTVALQPTSYSTLYTVITVTAEAQIDLGFKLSGNYGAGSVKAKNFQLRKIQDLDLANDGYKALAVKEGNKAALYISGPAASTVYFLAASYNEGAIADVKFGSATLGNGVSKIAIAAGEGYKLFIWDSNMNPLNTAFDVSALR